MIPDFEQKRNLYEDRAECRKYPQSKFARIALHWMMEAEVLDHAMHEITKENVKIKVDNSRMTIENIELTREMGDFVEKECQHDIFVKDDEEAA